MDHFPNTDNVTAVHMLLPTELVEALDLYRTRYISRTQHVAIAIQDYLNKLDTEGVAKKKSKSSWVLFSKK